MAEDEVLDVDPNSLSDRDCSTLTAEPRLKKIYEDKWNVKGVCEI